MSITSLLLVGFGGAFAVCWLINYVPLMSTFFGRPWSPRLLMCKTLGPLDVVVTIMLVTGGWVGLTTITGIGMMIYNVVTGIGLSMGVVFTKKVLKPRWEKQYKKLLDDQTEVIIIGEKVSDALPKV
jgi:hypothetical protein